MLRKKLLIVVTTYPLPSRSYDELVCTAGISEDGSWIRIYPVPLSFLSDQKLSGEFESGVKYSWIELDIEKRRDDFRPESYSPKNYDFRDLIVHQPRLGTERNWYLRKQYCLQNVYTCLTKLILDSQAPGNISLATFKPSTVIGFEWEQDDREWKNEWVEIRKQTDLFAQGSIDPAKMIPKVPFKFYYKFADANGRISRLMIEDWEIGQLFWNCKRVATEEIALQKVKEMYLDRFVSRNDIYFFLGTTKEWHMRRAKNPFVIIGVFYPKKEIQGSLF
jgi:hypothetical protein